MKFLHVCLYLSSVHSCDLYALVVHSQSVILFPVSSGVHLPGGVTSVNEDIGSGSVRAGIAGQVDVGTLQFRRLRVATQRNHALPQVLSFLVNKVGETGVDVAGGNGVDSGKTSPLVSERLR